MGWLSKKINDAKQEKKDEKWAKQLAGWGPAVQELRQKLHASEAIDAIMTTLCENEAWAISRQTANDSGERWVRVTPDVFEIRWPGPVSVNSEGRVTRQFPGEVRYSLTKSGFSPLGSFNGIPVDGVVRLWAEEIQERFKQMVPGCSVGNYEETPAYTFTYTLPVPTRKAF